MGFSFQVFPSRPGLPDPGEVCARATALLRDRIAELPVGRMVFLSDELLERAGALLQRAAGAAGIEPGARDGWGAGALTFSVLPGSGSGAIRVLELGDWTWFEPEAGRLHERGLVERWERARRWGRRFEVSRMFGEPALGAFGHGLVAAALAEATDGFLFSPDGAWDGALLPCCAQEFLRTFLRPECATSERFRRFAEERLRALPRELEIFDAAFGEAVLQQIAAGLIRDLNRVRGNPSAEYAALEQALARVETSRVLSGGSRELERRVFVGSQGGYSPAGPEGALARLHPTVAEYERWLGQLGEMLP